MRLVGLVVLIVSFSAQAAWPPASEITLITGHAHTQSEQELQLKHPVFVDEQGREFPVEFETQRSAIAWKHLTETGSVHVTVIGKMKDDVLEVFAVENYVENKSERENSTAALRHKAMQAWSTLISEISKNTTWMGTFRRADASNTGRHNAMSLLLTRNFIEYLITSTKDRGFLQAINFLGQLAKDGIPESQIKTYLSAIKDILKLAEPQSTRIEREKLLKEEGREDLCSELVAQGNFESVVSNLERKLSE